ncbi:hypothetical protein pb186bvf_018406 [Paramecium bursaria]
MFFYKNSFFYFLAFILDCTWFFTISMLTMMSLYNLFTTFTFFLF